MADTPSPDGVTRPGGHHASPAVTGGAGHRLPATDLRLAALFIMGSACSFAIMGAAVKVASQEVPTTMSVFFRNMFGWALMIPWALRVGPRALHTRQFGGHVLRAVAGLAAMMCFFTALGRLRLADASVLNQAFPLFLPIIERVWLKHQVSPRVIAALLVGFGGVVCVLRPGAGMFTPIASIGAASAVFAAVAQVGIRQLTATEPVPRIVFYFGAIASAISAVPLLWTWVQPSPVTWMALAGTGVAATAGQLMLTRGYSHAPAASVGPFIYVGVLCSAAIDWLFWDTPPDVWFAAGALLIISAGMALLRTHDAIDA